MEEEKTIVVVFGHNYALWSAWGRVVIWGLDEYGEGVLEMRNSSKRIQKTHSASSDDQGQRGWTPGTNLKG